MDKLLRNKTAIFIFVAPALILFTAVLFIPIGTSFYYALCNYDKASRSYSFIGLGNFSKMLKDPTMRIALKTLSSTSSADNPRFSGPKATSLATVSSKS